MKNSDAQSDALQPGVNFKDQKTGLTVFGILMMLVGGFYGLLIVAGSAGRMMQDPQSSAPLPEYLLGMVFNLAITFAFLTLGIGSMRAKRWSRALTLLLAWSGLATGILSIIFVMMFLPTALAGSQTEPAAVVFAMAFVLALMSIFLIILPVLLIWFYAKEDTRLTCQYYDRQPGWTDRIPLPVLALVIIFGFTAVTSAGGMFTISSIPVMGFVLDGFGRNVYMLLSGVIGAGIAYGLFHMDVRAWFGALGFTLFSGISMVIAMINDQFREIAMASVPPEQSEIINALFLHHTDMITAVLVIVNVGYIAYIWWTGRYFGPETA